MHRERRVTFATTPTAAACASLNAEATPGAAILARSTDNLLLSRTLSSCETSSFCSSPTRCRAASATAAAAATSDAPKRSMFDSSKTPGSSRPSALRAPLTTTRSLAHQSRQSLEGSLDSRGRRIVTLTCIAVPKFAGLDVKKPSLSLLAKPRPGPRAASTAARASASRASARPTASSLRSTDNRKCSCSLTHATRVLSLFAKTPRPSGQCRPRPVESSSLESGASKSTPASRRDRSSSMSMPPGAGAWLCEPGKGRYAPPAAPLCPSAPLSSRSTSRRSSRDIAGVKRTPVKLREA
mmetsp:Transcript_41674/g.120743  ORF Transcript_41674/g.120743 Transcript_41674/m.120743 type:complete len:297 (+) Transcript_41674:436-1326(+)